MAIQKTEGIVLRRQDFRETSIVLTFFTRDFGKIKGLMKGVRGPRAPHGAGGLELFARDALVFYERKRADLYTVSQCDLLDFFFPLRADLERLAYTAYLVELLDSVTMLNDKNEEIFDLILNCLIFLSGDSSARRIARIFEVKLLGLLGLMPHLGSCLQCRGKVLERARFSLKEGGLLCSRCIGRDKESLPLLPGTVRFIQHVKVSPFETVTRIKVSQKVGKEVEMLLRRFLRFHIERRLKTLDFLRSVGAA